MLRSDLLALRHDRSTEVVFYRPTKIPLSTAGQAAADKLVATASALLAHGGDHVCANWSMADVDLALMLQRLVRNADAVPAQLVRYAERQWQLPAIQEWLAIKRPAL